jgi:hypothetical protein
MSASHDDGKRPPAGATAMPVEPPITLRDYFAASALQGLTTRRPAGVPTSATELARFAFEIADAMLAARHE